MKARIVSLTNQKGGCGKSLACAMLGGELASRGYRVLIVDGDSQGTTTSWSIAAPDDTPCPVTVINLSQFAEKMHREIQKQLDNYDFILVDCPPSLEALVSQSALLVANLAIVPLPPSPSDLWAARGAKALIEKAQTINEGLKAVILPNKVGRTSLSAAIMRKLETFGIPLMTSRLSNRVAYQEAFIEGVSVRDLGRNAKPAADEIRAMTDEVLAILGEDK